MSEHQYPLKALQWFYRIMVSDHDNEPHNFNGNDRVTSRDKLDLVPIMDRRAIAAIRMV